MNLDSLPRPRTLPCSGPQQNLKKRRASAPGCVEALGKQGSRGERDANAWPLAAATFLPFKGRTKRRPSASPARQTQKQKLAVEQLSGKGLRGEEANVSPSVRPGDPTRPGTFAGALACPLHRRAVVYKLFSGIRAATTPFVLDGFRPGREGQTNRSLATLNLPVAFRFTTVFNVNAFRNLQSNDSVYLFWCRKVSKSAGAVLRASL